MKNQKEYSRNILARKLEEFVSKGRNKFYLRDIVEEADVPLPEAEDFFIPLLKESEVEGSLEARCPTCGAELGTYRSYPQVPEKLECELCGTRIPKSTDFLEIVLEVKGKFFRAQEVSFTSYSEETHEGGNERVIERCLRRTEWNKEGRKVRGLL